MRCDRRSMLPRRSSVHDTCSLHITIVPVKSLTVGMLGMVGMIPGDRLDRLHGILWLTVTLVPDVVAFQFHVGWPLPLPQFIDLPTSGQSQDSGIGSQNSGIPHFEQGRRSLISDHHRASSQEALITSKKSSIDNQYGSLTIRQGVRARQCPRLASSVSARIQNSTDCPEDDTPPFPLSLLLGTFARG